ncbi:MAG: M14 family metallopeptidase [Patescibacteria group bacterium]
MTILGRDVRSAILFVIIITVLGTALYFFLSDEEDPVVEEEEPEEISDPEPEWPAHSVIGQSVRGHDIDVYEYSHQALKEDERAHVLFVGGIHGGYEWNSVLLAYKMMDHLEENPSVIPEGVSVSIIPSANPDGVEAVIGKTGRFDPSEAPPTEETTHGRFNANEVDLNRNFACNWAPQSTWKSEIIDAGSEAFSEPEARAIKGYVEDSQPDAVIFWHSASGAVYGSECNEGVLPGTMDIMNAYANASGYPAVASFDHYEITGDAEGWLASIGVPSITVELSTHEDLEWGQNKAGFDAIVNYFSERR